MEATPTGDGTMAPETSTPTPGEDGDTDDDSTESSDVTPQSAVGDGNPFADATVVNGTAYNGSQQSSAVIRNETANNRQLFEYTDESGETSSVYATEDYVAVRNGSTGEVEYGGPDSGLGAFVAFEAMVTAYGPTLFVGVVEWEQTGTTTVDGEEALVFGSDSFNQTGYEEGDIQITFESDEVESTDGRMVITSDGQVTSVDIEIETVDGTYGGNISAEYDDITVTQPSWVDESQAP